MSTGRTFMMGEMGLADITLKNILTIAYFCW